MHTSNPHANFVNSLHRTSVQEAAYYLDQTLLRLEVAEGAEPHASVIDFSSLVRRDVRHLAKAEATSQHDKLLQLSMLHRVGTLLGTDQEDYRDAMCVMVARRSKHIG